MVWLARRPHPPAMIHPAHPRDAPAPAPEAAGRSAWWRRVAAKAASLGLGLLAACSHYTPLRDPELRPRPPRPPGRGGVTATFLGNTTLLITDGTTRLLVDGFVSRPSVARALLGKVRADPQAIESALGRYGVTRRGGLDAVLVGHSHYDHALDATAIAGRSGAVVMANASFRFIHLANGGDAAKLVVVPNDGTVREFGAFTVTFVPSAHVGSHSSLERKVEGEITRPVRLPARITAFRCGQPHAIHIHHPQGDILVTTTAGSRMVAGELKADVVFLAIALLDKEPAAKQRAYWRDYVTASAPQVVVPIHWDRFDRRLEAGLKPFPWFIDDVRKSLGFLQQQARDGPRLRILDAHESIHLDHGQVGGVGGTETPAGRGGG